jgi:hypothetical protein
MSDVLALAWSISVTARKLVFAGIRASFGAESGWVLENRPIAASGPETTTNNTLDGDRDRSH